MSRITYQISYNKTLYYENNEFQIEIDSILKFFNEWIKQDINQLNDDALVSNQLRVKELNKPKYLICYLDDDYLGDEQSLNELKQFNLEDNVYIIKNDLKWCTNDEILRDLMLITGWKNINKRCYNVSVCWGYYPGCDAKKAVLKEIILRELSESKHETSSTLFIMILAAYLYFH